MRSNSVILDIFNGVREHRETMNMPQDVIRKNMNAVCDSYDELKENLSPQLLNLFQKHVDSLEDNWSDELDFYFVEGFKLGLLIGIECMEESKDS